MVCSGCAEHYQAIAPLRFVQLPLTVRLRGYYYDTGE